MFVALSSTKVPPAFTVKEVPVPFQEPLAPESVTELRLTVNAPVAVLAAVSCRVPAPAKVRLAADVPFDMTPWIEVAPGPAIVNVTAPVLANVKAPLTISDLPEVMLLIRVRLVVPVPSVREPPALLSVKPDEPVKVAGSPPSVTGMEIVWSADASIVPPRKSRTDDVVVIALFRIRRP